MATLASHCWVGVITSGTKHDATSSSLECSRREKIVLETNQNWVFAVQHEIGRKNLLFIHRSWKCTRQSTKASTSSPSYATQSSNPVECCLPSTFLNIVAGLKLKAFFVLQDFRYGFSFHRSSQNISTHKLNNSTAVFSMWIMGKRYPHCTKGNSREHLMKSIVRVVECFTVRIQLFEWILIFQWNLSMKSKGISISIYLSTRFVFIMCNAVYELWLGSSISIIDLIWPQPTQNFTASNFLVKFKFGIFRGRFHPKWFADLSSECWVLSVVGGTPKRRKRETKCGAKVLFWFIMKNLLGVMRIFMVPFVW